MSKKTIEKTLSVAVTDINQAQTTKAQMTVGDYPGEPPKNRFKIVIQNKSIWQEIALTSEQVKGLFQAWNEAFNI